MEKDILSELQKDVEALKTLYPVLETQIQHNNVQFQLDQSELKEQMQATAKGLEATTAKLEETRSVVAQLETEVDQSHQTISEMRQNLKTTTAMLEETRNAVSKLETEAEQDRKKIDELSRELETTKEKLEIAKTALETQPSISWLKKIFSSQNKNKSPLDNAEYHNLIVSSPTSPHLKPVQWLHKSSYEHCEGKLQIGDNGIIRCERCDTQMPALEWYIFGDSHLSELQLGGGKKIDISDVISFVGQMVLTTGQKWMMRALTHIE
jgi:predicted RNase H-like nuclease (RuvC/YqgF family)